MRAIGREPDRIQIIFNQMVSVRGGRMSKRAGNVVTLQEVVDEVGRDATRFFFALRSPGAHFEFDLVLAGARRRDPPPRRAGAGLARRRRAGNALMESSKEAR